MWEGTTQGLQHLGAEAHLTFYHNFSDPWWSVPLTCKINSWSSQDSDILSHYVIRPNPEVQGYAATAAAVQSSPTL